MTELDDTAIAPAGGRLARNRERIYRAAVALFAEQGPNAVTMDDIAAAAGMSRSSVFNHFPSKLQLLAEFFGRMTREMLAEVEARPEADFRQALTDLAEIAAAHATRHGRTMAAIALLTAPEQPLEAAERDADDALLVFLTARARQAQATGELRRDHSAADLAGLVLALMTASAHEWVAGGRRASLRALLDTRFSLLIDGLVQKN